MSLQAADASAKLDTAHSLNDTSIDTVPRFDNSEQTPSPLPSYLLDRDTPVDTRPPEYGIPAYEQDHDAGRVDPRDGQDVVDLLNQRGGTSADDIGTSASTSQPSFPKGVFYGDLRRRDESQPPLPRDESDSSPAQPIDWKRWELQSPGYRSHRSAQPAPTLH